MSHGDLHQVMPKRAPPRQPALVRGKSVKRREKGGGGREGGGGQCAKFLFFYCLVFLLFIAWSWPGLITETQSPWNHWVYIIAG